MPQQSADRDPGAARESTPRPPAPQTVMHSNGGFAAWFAGFAKSAAGLAGSGWAFGLAVVAVVGWGLLGPRFHYSDTWQLVINTLSSVVTFMMVFLIQNTQNRDSKALHLKLDELIRAVQGARTRLVHLEDLSDEELGDLQTQFKQLHDRLSEHERREAEERHAARHQDHAA